MSFDIAKYPTLALVDSTQELRLLPKESLPETLRRTAPLFTRQR
ncbi:1-deoxy-D-xylulose-5-phosphate synthase [Escherichia coli]|uniref:1-deoxy-D-xylulose-5-phosphate synthase n=1 Tax=Escherichia coli TaxID=562 RepID=A0A376U3J2_ECOLX|nr:1-deoxy-D-xylulose-5-phosphate synthase [Escherichia coli]